MLQYLVRRLLWFIPVFFLVTGITFVTMHALPGGPFDSDKTPPALVQQMEATFGLNRPIYVQYAIWLGQCGAIEVRAVVGLAGQDGGELLLPGLAVSAQLGVMALLFALATGMPAGIIAALRRGKWQDRAAMGASILGVSVPAIVLGPVLYWLFGLHFGWLPVAKWVSLDQGLLALHQPCDSAGGDFGRRSGGYRCTAGAGQPAAGAARGLHPYGAR